MILSLRDKLQGTVAFVLVGIIIIPFALFGIDSLFLGGGSDGNEVASVNRVPITEQRLQQAVAMQKQQILARLGDVDPSLIDESRLVEPVLERLIRQEALRQQAVDAGMNVAPQAVQLALRDEPAFQTGGQFDRGRFEFLVRQMGYTPSSYLALIKDELVSQQVYQAVAYSEFTTSGELEALVRLLAEERDLSYLHLPASRFADELEPDEATLRAYYEARADSYVQPEQLVLEVINLSAEELAGRVEVEEAEIERFFQEELAALPDNRGWEVAHILIADGDQERLTTVREQLDRGVSFADLAREYSDDAGSARQGGALGFGGEDDFPPEFVAALETLETGEVSGPVRTGSGVHLLQLIAVAEGDERPDLEGERERIASDLRLLKAREQMIDLVDRLREQAYNAVSLRDVADDLGVPFEVSEPISREGGSGVLGHPRVVSAAFSQEVYQDGFASEVIELAPDHVVVVMVEEKIPARQLAFEEVEEQVTASWMVSEARDRALASGRELLEWLSSDPARAEARMEALGLEWRSLESVTRGDPRLPAAIQTLAFSAPSDAADPEGRLLPSGDFAIVRVAEVRPGDPARLSQAELTQLRGQLINDRATRSIQSVEEVAVSDARVRR